MELNRDTLLPEALVLARHWSVYRRALTYKTRAGVGARAQKTPSLFNYCWRAAVSELGECPLGLVGAPLLSGKINSEL